MQHSHRLREALTLAQELIRIPSANPPGNEADIAALAVDWLKRHEIRSQLVELALGRSSVVARIRGLRKGSVVLCGHLDTVPAGQSPWKRPPFEPRIEEDRLWGLGAADMKSGVAVLMEAAAWLVQERIDPSRDVVLVLTADEEWGYRGAKTVAESGLLDDAEILLIAEPTDGRIHAGQKGELWIEAEFTGKAAHGSMPTTGISSILPAVEFVRRIQHTIDALPTAVSGERTTINVGRFDGGRQVNIVPDHTLIQLDIRIVDPDHYASIVDAVEHIGNACMANGSRFAHRVMSYHPPILSALDHPFARALRERVGIELHDDAQFPMTPYSTDAVSIVPVLGVPVLIWGPGSIAQAHQPDEFIEIAAIERALDVLTHTLETF